MTDRNICNGLRQYRLILPKTTQIVKEMDKKQTKKQRRLYTCCECAEVFVRFAKLIAHEMQHVDEQNQEVPICEFCLSLYQNFETLRKHKTSIHTNHRHLCLLCEKHYNSRRYLLRHMQEMHNQIQVIFYCQICNGRPQFMSRSLLVEHFQREHAIKGHQTIEPISADDYEFEMTEEFLDEFLLNNDNDSSFAFTEWETLGDLKLPDMLLNETPATATGATINSTSTTTIIKPINYKCPQADCMENCQDLKEFFVHLRLRHKIDLNPKINKIFPCPYCQREHKRMSYLRQHLRVRHAMQKKHICQICDKQFASMDHLRKHVLSIHHNERRYVCNFCQKSFTQLSHLKQHLPKHNTEKPE